MSDAAFSLVTSLFTVGGFIGSLSANIAMDRYGRKGATRISALFNAAGATISGLAASIASMALGRLASFLVGVAAGIGICVGPIYLSEIAPPDIKGSLGVLTQLAIVIGIMASQAIGFTLATPTHWRLVLFLSSALSVIQFLLAPPIVESPAYLLRHALIAERKAAIQSLWGSQSGVARPDPENIAEEPLLTSNDDVSDAEHSSVVTVPKLLTSPELRRPLFTVVFAMLSQQTSGINAGKIFTQHNLLGMLTEY
ncbi:general substrate transporter [Chiua virens]|nr:general substrate transporter [Chiua virens]